MQCRQTERIMSSYGLDGGDMKPTRLPALIAGAIVLAAPGLPATAQVGLAPPAADRPVW